MLVFLTSALAAVGGYGWRFMPRYWFLIILLFLIAAVIATALAATSTKTAVAVTENGIIFHPRWFPLIEFQDIAEIILVPRVEKMPGRTHTYIKEQWRPVRLGVRNLQKYSAKVPALMRLGLEHPTERELARIEIPFMGTTGDAREFYRVVCERAPAARKEDLSSPDRPANHTN